MFAFVACRQWVYKVFIVYFSVCFRMNMFLIKWIFFLLGAGGSFCDAPGSVLALFFLLALSPLT